MTESQPRIYGYVYDWGTSEDLPAAAQEDKIRQRAAEMDGKWLHCRADRTVSGRTAPFGRRLEARKLLKELKPDDWLIVWRLDSFGDSLREILHALTPVGARRVNVCVLDHGGDDLEITSAYSEIFRKLLGPLAKVEANRTSRRTRNALDFRRRVGLAYARRPPYGKRRFHHPDFDGRVLKSDRWHQRECAQIWEIAARHDRGESFDSIAADFLRRREKTAHGKPWVPKPRPGKRLNTCRIRRAYH